MTGEQAFQELIEAMLKKMPVSVTVGTVKSVDRKNGTCDVVRDEQPTLYNVRLNAVIDAFDSYVTCYPAKDSFVLCMRIDDPTSYVVVAMSKIDEIDAKTGGSRVNISASGIVFNDGALGGLPKIDPLLSKINVLESQINALKTILSAYAALPPDGEITLKSSLTTWSAQPIMPTTKTELENTKVKQ